MKFERITTPKHPLYTRAIKLYQSSFPLHEQREAASQIEILADPAYHFDVICDNTEFIGEILYWDLGGALYIEHFCVHPSMRNRHYGERILKTYQSLPLILEIDPPTNEIAIRRKGFYERCGLVENPYPHIHPPYHKGTTGHTLMIMSSPQRLSPDEYERFDHFLQNTVMKNAY